MYGPSSPHRRNRAGLWFAAFTIVSLLMLLASSTEQARTLQQVTARALDPVRQTLGGIGGGIAGLFGAVGDPRRGLVALEHEGQVKPIDAVRQLYLLATEP